MNLEMQPQYSVAGVADRAFRGSFSRL
jgi:hypothetical protein